VCEWVAVWGRVVHCTFWDNHWMYLLARAAKDDWKGEQGVVLWCGAADTSSTRFCTQAACTDSYTSAFSQPAIMLLLLPPVQQTHPSQSFLLPTGVVDWRPFIPGLYSHMLACFHVPVGTATASCPTAVQVPHKASVLFGTKLDQVGYCWGWRGLGFCWGWRG
jgi:hypothetical protein